MVFIKIHGVATGEISPSARVGKAKTLSSKVIAPPVVEILPVIPDMDSGFITVNVTFPSLSEMQSIEKE